MSGASMGTSYRGLSPRMRGNPSSTWSSSTLRRRGSIPAHAGEPAVPPMRRRSCGCLPWVYPRACGGTLAALLRSPTGVYPRACGGTEPFRTLSTYRGSIPAHAGEPLDGRSRPGTPSTGLSPRMRGNPVDGIRPVRGFRVYPRACGGTYEQAGPTRFGDKGLSPRMRGNLGVARRKRGVFNGGTRPEAEFHGSIPAHAGEPSMPDGRTGLSPRMRGNRQ